MAGVRDRVAVMTGAANGLAGRQASVGRGRPAGPLVSNIVHAFRIRRRHQPGCLVEYP